MNLTDQFWHTFRKHLFQTFDSFYWRFKKQNFIWKRKIFTSRKSSGNAKSFSDKTAWSFLNKRRNVLAQHPKKLLELIFFCREKITCRFSPGHVDWSSDSTAESISSKVLELVDKTTKRENFFPPRKVSSIFSLENWHGFPIKFLKKIQQETGFFASVWIIQRNWSFSPKSDLSNSPSVKKSALLSTLMKLSLMNSGIFSCIITYKKVLTSLQKVFP